MTAAAKPALKRLAAVLLFAGASAGAAADAPDTAPPGAVEGARAQEQPQAGLGAVLGELRNGGFVIYFRHTATEQSSATDEAADLGRCETQRPLSAEGRAQAQAIGKSVKALGIPIGRVEASPFCRTKDAARLAFGRFAVNADLSFVISTDAAETERLGNSLRRMLSTPPARGTNTVLVSHSANLREAAGIFAKPEGVAYVFRPLAGGGFKAIATILPGDWARAAAKR